jgi:hypothetical protein
MRWKTCIEPSRSTRRGIDPVLRLGPAAVAGTGGQRGLPVGMVPPTPPTVTAAPGPLRQGPGAAIDVGESLFARGRDQPPVLASVVGRHRVFVFTMVTLP